MLLCDVGLPQAVSNLTTKPATLQSSSNALILSWSASSSPVQLHYTVTVRLTNTNSTSTTTITMFNTSSTIPSLSVETTSLPVQAHQSVISMCGVSLYHCLPTNSTTPDQVCSFWPKNCCITIIVWSSIIYKWFTASITAAYLFDYVDCHIEQYCVILAVCTVHHW